MDKVWYNQFKKAPWTPPDYWFGIIWPILYTLMFISLYMVYNNRKALTLFVIQFVLNIIWTTIFFRLKMIKLALFDLILLLFVVVMTIRVFYSINKFAAILLLPYLLWLFVAFSLNLYIVIHN